MVLFLSCVCVCDLFMFRVNDSAHPVDSLAIHNPTIAVHSSAPERTGTPAARETAAALSAAREVAATSRDEARRVSNPPLAFTRYCHYQYCMVYGIPTGVEGGGVYCTISRVNPLYIYIYTYPSEKPASA